MDEQQRLQEDNILPLEGVDPEMPVAVETSPIDETMTEPAQPESEEIPQVSEAIGEAAPADTRSELADSESTETDVPREDASGDTLYVEDGAQAEEASDADAAEEPAVDIRAILRQARASATAPEAEVPVETGDLPAEATDERAWFVIHCYSGYEKKVKHNLEQRIETMGMADQIFQVVVPTEEEIEVKEGKRRTVERRVFPGYILVQMAMNDDSWYVVRNTPGVTGFVGMGNKPTPLRQEEVQGIIKRMEAEAPKVKVTFKPGQKVRIIDGPFNDFHGIVDEIDMDKAKARVMVSFFGRDTPVELDFLQVEKI